MHVTHVEVISVNQPLPQPAHLLSEKMANNLRNVCALGPIIGRIKVFPLLLCPEIRAFTWDQGLCFSSFF